MNDRTRETLAERDRRVERWGENFALVVVVVAIVFATWVVVEIAS